MSFGGGNDDTDSLCSGVDWGHKHNWVSAGDGKGICLAVGSRSKGESSQDAGSIAEPRRTYEAICGHLLSGRRGIFRTAGVCGEVSSYECSFHRYRSAEWSKVGVVRSPAQNVQEDSHCWSARSVWDERRYRALSRKARSPYAHGSRKPGWNNPRWPCS